MKTLFTYKTVAITNVFYDETGRFLVNPLEYYRDQIIRLGYFPTQKAKGE